MEQSMLENSKGATYMSFILDIEIVIKKDDTKANLAETKAKSQVPKKKGEDQTYGASRQQDVKVYAVPSMEPTKKSIFNFPLKPTQDDKLSHSDKYRKPNQHLLHQNTDKNLSKTNNETQEKSQDKENRPVNKCMSEKANSEDSLVKTNFSDNGNINPNKKRPKKKKLTKDEKKQKVFKGKVEPIDFLECNRIFMCNYFKIPMSRKKRNIRAKNRLSDSNISTLAEDEYLKTISYNEQKSFSAQKLDSNSGKNQKLFKFWKNSSIVKNTDSYLDYSAGDAVATNQYFVDTNNPDLENLNKIENDIRQISDGKPRIRRKHHLIRAFKLTDTRINSIPKRKSEQADIDTHRSVNDENLCQNNKYGQECENAVLRKSKSLTKIYGSKIFKSANYSSSDTTQIKKRKTYWAKHESLIKALKSKMVLTSKRTTESLIGLQINLNDDVEFVLAPQTSNKNNSIQSKKSSVDNVFRLKRGDSQCKQTFIPKQPSKISNVIDHTAHVNCCTGQRQDITVACKVSQNKFSGPEAKFVRDRNLNILSEDKGSLKFTTENTQKLKTQNKEEIKTEVLSGLQMTFPVEPDLLTNHHDNNGSEGVKENYSSSKDNIGLKEHKSDMFKSKEAAKETPNQLFNKTLPSSSSRNHFNETMYQTIDEEFSQVSIENQVKDTNEEKQSEKTNNSPSAGLKNKIYSYMTNFSKKVRQFKLYN